MDTNLIHQYCEELSTQHSCLLEALYRDSHLKTLKPRMVSGPLQGRLLSMISKLVRPKHILEIGTFTGYATLCLAEGLAPGGKITTIEVNPELSFISDAYFQRSAFANVISALIGDARDIISNSEDNYDLVFIDAKKQDYSTYFDLLIDKLAPSGWMLADNVLWSGKVLEEKHDTTTAAIHAFNEKIKADPRVENVIIPIRDGINAIRKVE